MRRTPHSLPPIRDYRPSMPVNPVRPGQTINEPGMERDWAQSQLHQAMPVESPSYKQLLSKLTATGFTTEELQGQVMEGLRSGHLPANPTQQHVQDYLEQRHDIPRYEQHRRQVGEQGAMSLVDWQRTPEHKKNLELGAIHTSALEKDPYGKPIVPAGYFMGKGHSSHVYPMDVLTQASPLGMEPGGGVFTTFGSKETTPVKRKQQFGTLPQIYATGLERTTTTMKAGPLSTRPEQVQHVQAVMLLGGGAGAPGQAEVTGALGRFGYSVTQDIYGTGERHITPEMVQAPAGTQFAAGQSRQLIQGMHPTANQQWGLTVKEWAPISREQERRLPGGGTETYTQRGMRMIGEHAADIGVAQAYSKFGGQKETLTLNQQVGQITSATGENLGAQMLGQAKDPLGLAYSHMMTRSPEELRQATGISQLPGSWGELGAGGYHGFMNLAREQNLVQAVHIPRTASGQELRRQAGLAPDAPLTPEALQGTGIIPESLKRRPATHETLPGQPMVEQWDYTLKAEAFVGKVAAQFGTDAPVKRTRMGADDLAAMAKLDPVTHARIMRQGAPVHQASTDIMNAMLASTGQATAPEDVTQLSRQRAQAMLATSQAQARMTLGLGHEAAVPIEAQQEAFMQQLSTSQGFSSIPTSQGDIVMPPGASLQRYRAAGVQENEEISRVGRRTMGLYAAYAGGNPEQTMAAAARLQEAQVEIAGGSQGLRNVTNRDITGGMVGTTLRGDPRMAPHEAYVPGMGGQAIRPMAYPNIGPEAQNINVVGMQESEAVARGLDPTSQYWGSDIRELLHRDNDGDIGYALNIGAAKIQNGKLVSSNGQQITSPSQLRAMAMKARKLTGGNQEQEHVLQSPDAPRSTAEALEQLARAPHTMTQAQFQGRLETGSELYGVVGQYYNTMTRAQETAPGFARGSMNALHQAIYSQTQNPKRLGSDPQHLMDLAGFKIQANEKGNWGGYGKAIQTPEEKAAGKIPGGQVKYGMAGLRTQATQALLGMEQLTTQEKADLISRNPEEAAQMAGLITQYGEGSASQQISALKTLTQGSMGQESFFTQTGLGRGWGGMAIQRATQGAGAMDLEQIAERTGFSMETVQQLHGFGQAQERAVAGRAKPFGEMTTEERAADASRRAEAARTQVGAADIWPATGQGPRIFSQAVTTPSVVTGAAPAVGASYEAQRAADTPTVARMNAGWEQEITQKQAAVNATTPTPVAAAGSTSPAQTSWLGQNAAEVGATLAPSALARITSLAIHGQTAGQIAKQTGLDEITVRYARNYLKIPSQTTGAGLAQSPNPEFAAWVKAQGPQALAQASNRVEGVGAGQSTGGHPGWKGGVFQGAQAAIAAVPAGINGKARPTAPYGTEGFDFEGEPPAGGAPPTGGGSPPVATATPPAGGGKPGRSNWWENTNPTMTYGRAAMVYQLSEGMPSYGGQLQGMQARGQSLTAQSDPGLFKFAQLAARGHLEMPGIEAVSHMLAGEKNELTGKWSGGIKGVPLSHTTAARAMFDEERFDKIRPEDLQAAYDLMQASGAEQLFQQQELGTPAFQKAKARLGVTQQGQQQRAGWLGQGLGARQQGARLGQAFAGAEAELDPESGFGAAAQLREITAGPGGSREIAQQYAQLKTRYDAGTSAQQRELAPQINPLVESFKNLRSISEALIPTIKEQKDRITDSNKALTEQLGVSKAQMTATQAQLQTVRMATAALHGAEDPASQELRAQLTTQRYRLQGQMGREQQQILGLEGRIGAGQGQLEALDVSGVRGGAGIREVKPPPSLRQELGRLAAEAGDPARLFYTGSAISRGWNMMARPMQQAQDAYLEQQQARAGMNFALGSTTTDQSLQAQQTQRAAAADAQTTFGKGVWATTSSWLDTLGGAQREGAGSGLIEGAGRVAPYAGAAALAAFGGARLNVFKMGGKIIQHGAQALGGLLGGGGAAAAGGGAATGGGLAAPLAMGGAALGGIAAGVGVNEAMAGSQWDIGGMAGGAISGALGAMGPVGWGIDALRKNYGVENQLGFQSLANYPAAIGSMMGMGGGGSQSKEVIPVRIENYEDLGEWLQDATGVMREGQLAPRMERTQAYGMVGAFAEATGVTQAQLRTGGRESQLLQSLSQRMLDANIDPTAGANYMKAVPGAFGTMAGGRQSLALQEQMLGHLASPTDLANWMQSGQAVSPVLQQAGGGMWQNAPLRENVQRQYTQTVQEQGEFAGGRMLSRMTGGNIYDYSDLARGAGQDQMAITDERGRPLHQQEEYAIEDRQRQQQVGLNLGRQDSGGEWRGGRQEEEIGFMEQRFGLEQQFWTFRREAQVRDYGMSQRSQDLQIRQYEYQLGREEEVAKVKIEQQEKQFAMQERAFAMQTRFAHEDLDTKEQRMEVGRGWQVQDFERTREQFEATAGWKEEDLQRSLRYSTGRQRLDIQREMERSGTQAEWGREGMDIKEGRAATQYGWEQADLGRDRERLDERTQLERDRMDLARQYWEQETSMSEQDREMRHQFGQEQLQLMKDRQADSQWQFEKQQELDQVQKIQQDRETNFRIQNQKTDLEEARRRAVEQETLIKFQRQMTDNQLLFNMKQALGWDDAIKKAGELLKIQERIVELASGRSGGAVSAAPARPAAGSGQGQGSHPGAIRGFAEGGPVGAGGGFTHEGEHVVPVGGSLVKSDPQVVELLQLMLIEMMRTANGVEKVPASNGDSAGLNQLADMFSQSYRVR